MAHTGSSSCVGFERVTGLSAAKGLQSIPTEGCSFFVVQAESQGVRYRQDGTDPTSSVGMVIAAGSAIEFTTDPNRVRFIEQSASATLNVEYYK